MSEHKVHFGIKVDGMTKDQWSFGICLSHWCKETYLFISLFKWIVSIGWMSMPEKEGVEQNDKT